ncbi:hypothetical protein, partial [Brevundimonas sp.]|jgi:hypothetical protein|uniref:hypothetical protein n=1 Tax=Brevundimonas sp. TaxID=1871086 RepID=UPI00391D6DCE
MALRRANRRAKTFKFGPGALALGLLGFFLITGGVSWIAYDGSIAAEGPRWDSFWLSLTASFIEDAVFFALVGFVLFAMQSRQPGDDTLDGRLSSLLNGTRVSPDTRRRMSRHIEKHCAFSPRYAVTITYTGADSSMSAARAVVSNDRLIVNGFRDVTYEDRESGYTIYTDSVSAAGDQQGELMSVQTIEGGHVQDHILHPVPIPAKGIKNTLPLLIPPDGESGFYYKYWIWHGFGADFFTESRRLTSEVEVRLANASNVALTVKCHVHDHEFRLLPGQEHLYRLRDEPPGTRKIFALIRTDEALT